MRGAKSGLGCLGWTIIVVVTIAVILVAVFAWIVPSQRKSYSIDALHIQDVVLTDGTLSTVERFTYTFHGRFTRVYRDIPWDGHPITVLGVDGPQGELRRMPSGWTPAMGPPASITPGAEATPSPWTSIAPEERPPGYYRVTSAFAPSLGTVTRIEAFADLRDTTADFTFRWTAGGAAERWKDAGELEWQLVGRDWTVPIAKVRAVVGLPEGASRANVRAWGHGPLNGVLTVRADGSVALSVDDLPPETFVEVHELFPPDLLSEEDQVPIEVVDIRLATEQRLAAAANAVRAAARAQVAMEHRIDRTAWKVTVVAAALALAVWLFIFVRNGREYRPRFRARYLREVPEGLPPALVGVLWRMGPVNDADLTATLLGLAVDGVVRLEPDALARPAARRAQRRRRSGRARLQDDPPGGQAGPGRHAQRAAGRPPVRRGG